MIDQTAVKAKLTFRKNALEKLYAAYLALVEGGVKSYTIDDRQLTRFDLPVLKKEIDKLEQEVEELQGQLDGKRPRKALGVVPRDW